MRETRASFVCAALLLSSFLLTGAAPPPASPLRAELQPALASVIAFPDEMESGDSHSRRRAHDPLIGALHRIDRYFQRHEVDGVVLDSRYVVNATEAARLSVVPQLLGYAELYRVIPARRIRRDISRRADFLLDRFDAFRSGGVFDGMLGYALFEAFEATGDPRYLRKGLDVVMLRSHSPPRPRAAPVTRAWIPGRSSSWSPWFRIQLSNPA